MLKFTTVSGSDFSSIESEVNALRGRVWKDEGASFKQNGSGTFMIDRLDFDTSTYHFLYYSDTRLIAAARLFMTNSPDKTSESDPSIRESIAAMPGPYAAFSRLVVDREFRRQGLSDNLSRARILKAFQLGAGAMCISSVGEGRVSYWQNQGFELVGKCATTETDTYEINRPVFAFVGSVASIALAQERRQGERKVA